MRSFSLMTIDGIRTYSIYIVTYILTSYWFSPDLDVRRFRPGEHSFPLGPLFKGMNHIGKKVSFSKSFLSFLMVILFPFHKLLNISWKVYWQPFAECFTHRGAVHIPFFGTQLKIIYIYLTYYILKSFLQILPFSYDLISSLPFHDKSLIDGLFGNNGIYDLIFSNSFYLKIWLIIMIADICHISIDFWDSWKQGSNFIPPAAIAPRGAFLKFSKFLAERLFR